MRLLVPILAGLSLAAAQPSFTFKAAEPLLDYVAGWPPGRTRAEIGTDIPYDEAPPRTRYTFTHGGTLELIPLRDPGVKNFRAAYPDLDAAARSTRQHLKRGLPARQAAEGLALWNCPDAAPTIFAKARRIETPWCRGFLFLTTYTQEPGSPVDNAGLTCTFQGLSRDGHWFIQAHFTIHHPSLPETGLGFADRPAAEIRAEYARVEGRLDALPDAGFTPSLGVIDSLVQTLAPTKTARPTCPTMPSSPKP